MSLRSKFVALKGTYSLNIREVSSKFSVYICSADLDIGASAKVALSRAGYDVYFLESDHLLLDRIQQSPPHLIILHLANITLRLSQLVEQVFKVSPEIKFIFLNRDEDFKVLSEYIKYGVMDILWLATPSIDERILFSTDRVCERIYLNYQNEQLYDQLKKQPSAPLATKVSSSVSSPSLVPLMRDYKLAQTKEEIVQLFLDQFPNEKIFFFKYLPSISSLVLSQSSQPLEGPLKNLGVQLRPEESKDILQQIQLGVVFPSLREIFNQLGLGDEFRLFSLQDHHQMDGILAYKAGNLDEQIENQVWLMNLGYSNFCLMRKIEVLDITDPVTELYNRKHYLHKLKEEFERAKRIQQPLSIIKLSLDDFNEIESSLGEVTRDHVLKNLAGIMSKTSRANDMAFRTGLNEFTLILPHCSRKGAEVRSERTRRVVESSTLLEHGLRMSISLGASEYPSTCSSAEKLDETATKALQYISGKGGNKLCFFKAPADHKPDFVVTDAAVQ